MGRVRPQRAHFFSPDDVEAEPEDPVGADMLLVKVGMIVSFPQTLDSTISRSISR